MLCPRFPRSETRDLKMKKEGKLVRLMKEEKEEMVCVCVCVCVCIQVASRVLTHINFMSIFVLPVVKWGFSTSFHVWKENMPRGSSLLEKKLKEKKKGNNFYPLFRKMNRKERKKKFLNECFDSEAHRILPSSLFQQRRKIYMFKIEWNTSPLMILFLEVNPTISLNNFFSQFVIISQLMV